MSTAIVIADADVVRESLLLLLLHPSIHLASPKWTFKAAWRAEVTLGSSRL